jgi:hypothetical protein
MRAASIGGLLHYSAVRIGVAVFDDERTITPLAHPYIVIKGRGVASRPRSTARGLCCDPRIYALGTSNIILNVGAAS